MSLEERAEALKYNVLQPICTLHNIVEIRIEEPFSMFSGGKTTAKTMSSLQRFNGMVSLTAHQLLGKPPTLVGATTARSRCGIKVPRGTKAKTVVLQWVDEKFDNFIMEYTRHGNPKPGLDDEADAIVVALSHFDLRSTTNYWVTGDLDMKLTEAKLKQMILEELLREVAKNVDDLPDDVFI